MTPPTYPPPSGDDPTASWYREPSARRGRRKVAAVSLGVSLVLHLLLVLLYPLLVGPDARDGTRTPLPGELPAPEGIEIVRIVELPDDELSRPDRPETEREPLPRPPAPTRPAPAGPARAPEAGEPGEEGLSAAERVRATTPDARLLAPLSPEVVALSPEQIAQIELVWALESMNDSAAAAAEAYRRAMDWTYTDKDGKRWGISPQGLHLGGITIPMPHFGGPYDPEAWKGSMEGDLNRAAAGAAAADSREERARAIRERIDKERREAGDTTRAGGGGGGG